MIERGKIFVYMNIIVFFYRTRREKKRNQSI